MNIAVIGGNGRMGILITEILRKHGMTVFPVGRKTPNVKEIVRTCDVIFYSIPEAMLKSSIEQFGLAESTGPIHIDMSSQVFKNAKVFSSLFPSTAFMHLLFGPDTRVLKNQNVIVSEGIPDTRFRALVDLFKKEGAHITETSPEHHDRMMAMVQALSQFSSIALAKTISGLDTDKKELTDFSSITFSMNAATIARIVMQKPELWANIQFQNKFFKKILTTHLKNIKTLEHIVDAKDYKKFEKVFARITSFWGHDSENVDTAAIPIENELDQIRKKLDVIDTRLIELLAERQSYMKEVAQYKKTHGIAIYQPDREQAIVNMRLNQAKEFGIDEDIVKRVFEIIFEDSRKSQEAFDID